jgi:asparagine synthetase B (glutamine-hydrolysing)
MSGLAAAVAWDGVDVSAALAAMIEAGRHRAPDGVTRWAGSGAALARLHRLSLPAQRIGAQPAVERGGPHVLVLDGRLDHQPTATPGDDADRALEIVVRFGAEAAARLEGDFAFVAWNASTRVLLAGRDGMGQRPLYWTRHGSRLLIASDVRQLLAALPAVPPPNLAALAALLAFRPEIGAETLYSGIQRLPAGHVLVADAQGVRTRRYWRPEPAPAEGARSDADYVDECRALLDRVVAARLRAAARPAVFFSGGIDSSSVLASAVRIAQRSGAAVPLPLSLVFDAPESHEREYRQALAAQTGVGGEEVSPDPFDARAYLEQAARRGLPPDLPGQFIGRSMRRQAAAHGARVVLTGEGGDAVFSGSTFVYADLIRAGRVLAAIRQHRLDNTYDDSGYTALGLLSDGVWPLLPRTVRHRLRGAARRLGGVAGPPPWLRLPVERPDTVPDAPRGVPMAAWAIAWDLDHGWTKYFLEGFERDAVEWQLEPRHPLLDPAIVRFALALPEDQRRRGRITKFVLRAAAGLPPAVGARLTKSDLGFSLRDATDALGGRRFFERMRLAEAGWVDAAAACRGYDVVTRGPSPAGPVEGALLSRLWLLAAIEVWFRAAYDRAA